MTTLPTDPWRIDDLAHRAGVTVDTVRYYQREGLMPDGQRAGRVKLYGPPHLERLDRIRDLQGRGFSLAAIRALLDTGRQHLVEGIFADRDEGEAYSLDDLVERSGIDPDLCAALRAGGLLLDPTEYGRDAYDGEDLDLLRTMAELQRMGIPIPALVEMGRLYAQGVESMQRAVVDLFTTGGTLAWGPGELAAFQEASAGASADILPNARRVVEYLHHRTIQRLTLDAIEQQTAASPDPPV
jgi:DNA-binding transcriptional MerR regulator